MPSLSLSNSLTGRRRSLRRASAAYSFSDDFTGDVSDLALRTGWTRVQGTAGGATTSSGKVNTVSATGNDGTEALYTATAPTATPYFVQANFKKPVGNQGPWLLGTYVDRDNFVGMRLHSDGSCQVFEKMTLGGYIQRLSVAGGVDNDVLRIEVSSSWVITLKRNGTSIGSFTADTQTRGRGIGIFARQFAIAGFIDNFSAGLL